MPILVACRCGGRFQAQPELAGRQVPCPACGTMLFVPLGAEAPDKMAAEKRPILVACRCGQRFQARADLAGRQLMCPSCGGPLRVPAEEELYARASRDAARARRTSNENVELGSSLSQSRPLPYHAGASSDSFPPHVLYACISGGVVVALLAVVMILHHLLPSNRNQLAESNPSAALSSANNVNADHRSPAPASSANLFGENIKPDGRSDPTQAVQLTEPQTFRGYSIRVPAGWTSRSSQNPDLVGWAKMSGDGLTEGLVSVLVRLDWLKARLTREELAAWENSLRQSVPDGRPFERQTLNGMTCYHWQGDTWIGPHKFHTCHYVLMDGTTEVTVIGATRSSPGTSDYEAMEASLRSLSRQTSLFGF